uniref:Insulin-like domain-containing protein n=1 Tax=Cyclopterus lumpus TaxID=8103 RepID=A0A8C2ZXG4_CYCLU
MRALGVLPLLLCAWRWKLCGREFLRAVVYTCGDPWIFTFLLHVVVPGPPAGDQSSLESSKPGSELSRRDINNILTTVCCQVGCRKSDLAFLC